MKFTILIFLLSNLLFSNEINKYPEVGFNNFGTEFILTVPPNLSVPTQEHLEFINFIFFSPFDTKVKIEIANKGYSKELTLKPNENNGFKIPATIVQPYIKSGYVDYYYDMVIKNSAVKITSEMPISVLIYSDFENTGDSYLAIPMQNLGKEYVVSNYNDNSDFYKGFISLNSNVSIIATEDDTEIEFFYPSENTKIDIYGNKVSGQKFSKKLNKSDIWVMSSVSNGDDLSNARIKSNKPISVISSNQCANIPSQTEWCNFIMNMETPAEFWGYSYIVSKYEYKKYEPIVRIYAKESNTDIYINGEFYQKIENVYDTEKKSFIELIRNQDLNFEPFIISSDKPIFVSSYSTGGEEDGKQVPNGGPSMLNIPSIESMSNFINISSPNFPQDVSYNDNYVNLLVELDNSNNIPDSFEYGYLSGKDFVWRKIKDNFNIKYIKKIPYPYNNKIYAVICMDLPTNGNIKFRSDYKFTMINYGYSEYKSYGFQSIYNLKSNEIKDLTPPIIEWEVSCDSKIVGKIIEENLKGNLLIPDSNLTNMKVLDKSVNPAIFEIEIIDINKPAAGTIKVWDIYGNITTEKVIYTPQQIEINPKYLVINEKINRNVSATFDIVNKGSIEYKLDSILIDIPNAEYFINNQNTKDLAKPIIINPKSKLNIKLVIEFLRDTIIESKILLDDGCIQLERAFIKINIETPKIYVSDVNFQDISQGQTQVKQFAIYNRSNVPLSITDIIYPNFFDFDVYGIPLISKDRPIIIQANSEFTAYINLKSSKIGKIFDSLKVISDAPTYDNVCYIYANVLEPGLICEAYDFGKKEVYSKEFNDIEYIVDTLKVWNYGKRDLIIDSIELKSKNSDYFYIDSKQFENKLIPKNNFISYEVMYKPEKVGYHNIEYKVHLKDGVNANSNININATCVKSKLEFIDTLDFGRVMINTNLNTLNFNFSNLDYEFGSDLNSLNIVYNTDSLENNFFFLNNLPKNIKLGETILNYVNFGPKIIGNFRATLKVEGNFDGPKFIVLKGIGVDSKLDIPDLTYFAMACEGKKDTIKVKIINSGTTELFIEPLKFDPILPEYSFLNLEDALGEITINPSEEKEILIEFTSFGVDKEINLIVKDKTKLNPVIIELNGKNKHYENVYNVKPIRQSVEVSQPALSRVVLDDNKDIVESKVKDLRVTISFNPNILNLQENTLTLSNDLKTDFVISDLTKLDYGKYQFDLLSIGDRYIDKNTEIVSFIFNTFLSNTSNNVSKVDIDITARNNECVDFKTNGSAEIETILKCGNELQKIESNLIEFKISDITPNPLNRSINLNYSFPYDCNVNIKLIDINGNEVRSYINKYLKSGFYNFELNIDNISNGYYFLIYNAGNLSKQIPIIVNK